MSDLVPAQAGGARSPALLEPLRNPEGGSTFERVRAFAAQPPVRKALPWFVGVAGIGMLAMTWAALSPAPQRVL